MLADRIGPREPINPLIQIIMKRDEIIAGIETYCQGHIPHYEERVQWTLDLMDEFRCPMPSNLSDAICEQMGEWCLDHDIDPDTLDETWEITPEDILFYTE